MNDETPPLPALSKCISRDNERWGEEQQQQRERKESGSITPHVPGSQMLILGHTHAHRQWQTIAEEFSSLLDKDFVDVLFKVEGGSILAAHRALVAAVWPSMREELRKLKPPPETLRNAGLAWVNSTAVPENTRRETAAAADAAVEAVASSRLSASAAGETSPQIGDGETPGGPPTITRGISPAGQAAPSDTVVTSLELTSEVGVLDVSNRDWGTWSIVRALFCHLYSRPVAIQESELMLLRTAAERLGNWELAKCCDDTATLRNWPSYKQPQRVDRTSDSEDQRSTANDVESRASGISNTSEIFDGQGSISRNQSEDSGRLMPGHRTPEKKGKTSEDKGPDKPSMHPEARARSFVKTVGESSFNKSSADSEEQPAQSIRHVLSDLKRTMMEASRVISDKSFQSMYDMVPGERGILGEGINGPVRMARHKRTGREVAVKRISCVNLSEQRRQMLLSEVRIFLTVQHRNIIQLHEVFESEADQAVLLVMELCTGKELFERLAERKYYMEIDAARVTRQMLDAVAYLHSQNICHRDLKLENWLYENPSPDAKLKLCDFGFGQIVEPSVQLTATLGSLYYVAPEVLEGSYGLPCDMWSMGVIVYMLLSGNPPFDGKTDQDVIGRIRQGRFKTEGKRWDGISETAKHFLHSMLRKDPNERLSASECIQHAWLTMGSTSQHNMPKQMSDISIDQSVIRDMTKFAQNNAMTRAALGMLASSSTPFSGREEDVAALEARFKRFDGNNTGKIDAEEFAKTLRDSLGTEATTVFERIGAVKTVAPQRAADDEPPSKARKREVNYSDFITLTKAKRVANNSAAIREAFRAFDKDGEGFITDNRIRSILGEDFKGDEEMVKAILEKCDLNGEGLIDYVDFAAAFSEELSKKGDKQPAENSSDAAPPKEEGAMTKDGGKSPMGSDVSSKHFSEPTTQAAEKKRFDESIEGKLKSGAAASPRERAKGCSPRESSKKSAGTHEDQEEQEEGEDAHWEESDGEEQLVSVKETKAGEQPVSAEQEKQKKDQLTKASKSNRYNTFSLSLAGSAEHDDFSAAGVNRVASMPSDVYIIRQLPGFHKEILRPFYGTKPCSNVVMGLIRGTSLYAKQSVMAKLATIIHTICGWYFIMPNPKYHKEVNDRKGLLSKETGKFRFVAWWIHPRFVPQLRRWFEHMTYEGKDKERQEKKREQLERARENRNSQQANSQQARPAPQAEPSNSPRGDGGKPISENDVGIRFPDTTTETVPPSPKMPIMGSAASGDVAHPVSPRPQTKEAEPIAIEGLEGKESTPPHRIGKDEKERPASPAFPKSAANTAVNPPPPPPPDIQPPSKEVPKETKTSGDPQMGVGSPGDFQFSDVPKPENYLHTYRELHTREHIVMLSQLYEGTQRFLRTLFDENFLASAQISAGFHYPVRTQYATLHMQVRVNSGSVCREDGRGIDIHDLIETLQSDRLRFSRDEEQLRYQVTENIKVSLLAAANQYAENHPGVEVVRQTGMFAYDLGMVTMPTIKDEGEEEEDEEAEWKTQTSVPKKVVDPNQIGEYILNLQVASDTPYSRYLYKKRQVAAETFGKDPTYLYPLHVSVTGFFETTRGKIDQLVALIHELVSEELSEIRGSEPVIVKECLSVAAGYVLQDIEAPCITAVAKSLALRSQEIGISIRPKAVNHISLAAGRSEPELRAKIQDLYCEDENIRYNAQFELVLSRRYFRSSFDRLDLDGPHGFKEVARVPIVVLPSTSPTPPLLPPPVLQ